MRDAIIFTSGVISGMLLLIGISALINKMLTKDAVMEDDISGTD